MNLESRFLSGLIVLASVGAILYLGGLDAMIVVSVMDGHALLTFDWLQPIEGVLLVPWIVLMMVVVLLREIRRLTE